MNLTEKVEEFVWKKWKCIEFAWKCEGFSKKNEKYMENVEFVSKVKEFIWSNSVLSIGSLTSPVF